LGGSTLGGAPKAATTLGGGSTLGGAPKQATTLGGGSTLGAKPTTLGGAASSAAPAAAAATSSTDGSKDNDTTPTVGEDAAGGDSDDEEGGATTSSAASKKKKKKKPAKKTATADDGATAAAGAKKASGPSKLGALAEKLRREKEERERLEREEEERIKREEEEEKRREEEAKIAAVKAAEDLEIRRVRDRAAAEERKRQEAIEKRAELLAKFSGAKVVGLGSKPTSGTSTPASTESPDGAIATGSNAAATGKKKSAKERKAMAEEAKAKAEAAKEAAAAAAAEAAKPAVKDSWDDSSDDEDEEAAGDGANGSDAAGALKDDDAASSDSTLSTATGSSSSSNSGPALRSPICCVLGHVDTGKTKLLDKMRNTNVQDGEVGGITQQIGATYFPMETIKAFTADLNEKHNLQFKVPGLLVMDTPGHASFTNLRTRGSSLCDIAVLVVDIMHGLEPMTIESINLLRMRNTPFVVALNKVDRLFEWRSFKNKNIGYSLKHQAAHVIREYQQRVNEVIAQFAEQNLNADLYYNLKNMKDFSRQVSLVPTSAITGEGIPDLLSLIVQLTQRLMGDRLILKNELQCTVLEVKHLEGHGTTIDVILAAGTLKEGDRIVLCGLQGPIDTTIRALLTPPPLRELRIKDKYTHHKEIHAAQGLKISAQGLDKALAGSQLFVVHSDEEAESLREVVMKPLAQLREKIPKSSKGVYVQASTLGSLEALLDFLTTVCNIPIAEFGVGPIHARDVKLASVMLERAPDYACILAFDVNIAPEARELAAAMKVRIFEADIIYHLEKQFKDHMDALAEAKRSKAKADAIFPCLLSIKQDAIFHTRDPITLGVAVKGGVIRVGTPISVATANGWIDLGRIVSAERDHKPVEEVKTGDEAAISIVAADGAQKYLYGRHFTHTDELVSRITRTSLEALKEHYTEFCKQPANFKLLKRLKTAFIDSEQLAVPSSSS
jgi:translation initiation factor 5B